MDPIKMIGQKLAGGEERDAIHIAVLPVISASDRIWRGDPLRLAPGSTELVARAERIDDENCIGIADPFLGSRVIQKDERFWCFLKPGTVVGMRHHWTHPAIDNVPAFASESEKWLREFAFKWNFDYATMLSEAQRKGGYVVADGIDLHGSHDLDPGDEDLFWRHVQILTGRDFDQNHREAFGWSCSC